METELKLAFTSEEELLSCLHASWLRDAVEILEEKTEVYENAYLDTKDRFLHAHRTSLRVRKVNGESYIHTVKTSPVALKGEMDEAIRAGLTSRCEWNVRSNTADFDPDVFIQAAKDSEDPLPILVSSLAPIRGKALETVCRTVFTRRILVVIYEGSKLEICLDTGSCQAGGKSLPICEMEIERVSGPDDAVGDLGALVMRHAKCTGGSISKYARCLLLLKEAES